MKEVKLSVTFHLYPIDESFKIPAVDEFGEEDIECTVNSIRNIRYDLKKGAELFDHTLEMDTEKSEFYPLYSHSYYKGEELLFDLETIVDPRPWPQKDIELCNERKRMMDNHEIGRRWWIHHITFSTGGIIEPIDGSIVSSDYLTNFVHSFCFHAPYPKPSMEEMKEKVPDEGFIFLDKPTSFKEWSRGKDWDRVEISLLSPQSGFLRFADVFRYTDEKIEPLDGDSYVDTMDVYGYQEFPFPGPDFDLKGVAILTDSF